MCSSDLILNRLNVIDIWKDKEYFFEGIKYAIDEKYIIPELMEDNQIFGELIGERINGNPYRVDGYKWIPFDYIKEHYFFKFWVDIIKECAGKSDKEIFDIVSKVFEGLWCIYKRQHGIKGEVNKNVGFEGLAAEGIVFYNKKAGEMCKLRRDMFSWYCSRRHKEVGDGV